MHTTLCRLMLKLHGQQYHHHAIMTNLLLPFSTVSNLNTITTHMSTGYHLPGWDLLCCFHPVRHQDECVKLQDMHSKTTLPVSSSTHLTLNKERNKRFTKRHPSKPFDCLTHQGRYTKTHNIYDSQHII